MTQLCVTSFPITPPQPQDQLTVLLVVSPVLALEASHQVARALATVLTGDEPVSGGVNAWPSVFREGCRSMLCALSPTLRCFQPVVSECGPPKACDEALVEFQARWYLLDLFEDPHIPHRMYYIQDWPFFLCPEHKDCLQHPLPDLSLLSAYRVDAGEGQPLQMQRKLPPTALVLRLRREHIRFVQEEAAAVEHTPLVRASRLRGVRRASSPLRDTCLPKQLVPVYDGPMMHSERQALIALSRQSAPHKAKGPAYTAPKVKAASSRPEPARKRPRVAPPAPVRVSRGGPGRLVAKQAGLVPNQPALVLATRAQMAIGDLLSPVPATEILDRNDLC